MGRFIPTVTIILRWILCSCHRNSTVAIWPPLFLQKCCRGHIGPPYCESVFISSCRQGHRIFINIYGSLKNVNATKEN